MWLGYNVIHQKDRSNLKVLDRKTTFTLIHAFMTHAMHLDNTYNRARSPYKGPTIRYPGGWLGSLKKEKKTSEDSKSGEIEEKKLPQNVERKQKSP